jgi:hypothetical protein
VAGQWRERRAVGIDECHGRQCARNADRKAGGRGGCPLIVQALRRQWRTLPVGASLEEAKRARRGKPSGTNTQCDALRDRIGSVLVRVNQAADQKRERRLRYRRQCAARHENPFRQ